jgi:uncharacterized protein (TIGR02996 family)
MSPRADIEALIDEDPDGADHYLVLADLLTEAGDPRGELIVLQHRRRRDATASPKPSAREEALVAQLGPTPPGWNLIWWCGFVSKVQGRLEHAGGARGLRDVLAHPSARHVGHLDLDTGDEDGGGRVLETIGAAPCAPGLRSLALFQTTRGDGPPIGTLDLHALDERLPRLRRLEIKAMRIYLGGAPLALEELHLDGKVYGESLATYVLGLPLRTLRATHVTEPRPVLAALATAERPPALVELGGDSLADVPEDLDALARIEKIRFPDAPDEIREAITDRIPHARFSLPHDPDRYEDLGE